MLDAVQTEKESKSYPKAISNQVNQKGNVVGFTDSPAQLNKQNCFQ